MGGVTKIRDKRQKRIVLSFLIIISSCLLFTLPKPAAAQLPPIPPTPVIPTKVWPVHDYTQAVKDKIDKVKKDIAASVWKNAVRYLTQQIAHDMAVAAASGDIGQFPMFQPTERKKYITQLGDAAVGDLLDKLVYQWTCTSGMQAAQNAALRHADYYENSINYLSDAGMDTSNLETAKSAAENEYMVLDQEMAGGTCRQGMGIHLCQASPAVKAKIIMGVNVELGSRTQAKPACSLSKMAEQFGDTAKIMVDVGYDFGDLTPLVAYFAEKQKISGTGIKGIEGKTFHDIVTRSIPSLFSEEESDTGQYLQVAMEAQRGKMAAEAKAAAEQDKEWKPVRDMITGNIKTPSILIGETQKQSIEKVLGAEDTFTGVLVADAIGTFANTFMKQYLMNLLTKGLTSGGVGGGGGGGIPEYAIGGVAAAKAKFASFTKPHFGPSGVVNVLSELAVCPESPTVNNCVLDQKWEQAIEKKMRLEDAINDGYIDATKPFAFSPDGQALDCNTGLPYRSIIILRKYGIVPVSWEIAARFIKDHGGGNITLQMLINDFNNTESPYYGLVSKDWVLTMQENYCRRRGIGETINYESWQDSDGLKETPQTRLAERSAECVDDQTCIQEEEDGSCRAYGYCTKQKAIWRFQGTQCSEQYASCEKFISSSGNAVTYLKNTLDFNGCNADNSGCSWYCKEYNQTENDWNCFYDSVSHCAGGDRDGDACDVDGDCPGNGICTNYRSYDEANFPGGLATDKIAYLDGQTETCAESSAGCHEFIRTNKNLISNSSFQYIVNGDVADDDIEDTFWGWAESDPSLVLAYQKTDYVQSGDTALYLKQYTILPPPDQYLKFEVDSGHPIADRSFTFSYYGRCLTGAGTGTIEIIGGGEDIPGPANYSESWERISLTKTYSKSATGNTVAGLISLPTSCDIYLDSAQLEESNTALDYADYLEGEFIYLNGERLSCEEDEVGCTLYTPLHGGEPVPGKYYKTNPDYTCPQDMVGCQAVEEVALEPTNNVPCWDGASPECKNAWMSGKRCLDPQSKSCFDDGDCPGSSCLPIVSLIPLSGQQCSAIYNGCQEYTNLDVVAEGGEGLEYYTYVRQCVPLDHTEVRKYYTWVGDDTHGYQLIEWNLMRSNEGGPVNYAPCQKLSIGDDPHALICLDSGVSDCVFGVDPDCREYFDENLVSYKRLESKTIRATDDCHPLRNTYDANIYYGQPSLSYTCSQAMAGCREYRGSNGNNIQDVVNDDFEDGTNEDWTNLENSSTSVFIGGHSGVTPNNVTISKDVSSNLTQGRTYLLSFWAKAEYGSSLAPTIGFQDAGGAWQGTLFAKPLSTYPGEMKPQDADNWHQYIFGPVTVTWDPETTSTYLVMQDIADFAMEDHPTYFEKIVLTETTDQFYLIKDSAKLCQGQENCEEYRDLNNQSHYIKNFAQICPEDKVGCEALFDTQNNSYPFSKIFGRPEDPNSQITVLDDAIARFVVDAKKQCPSQDRGCTKVGIPVLDYVLAESNSTQTIAKYETFYLKDDAEKYDTIWCNQSELGCGKYTTTDNSYAYFKDPQDRVCIYLRPPGKDAEKWYKWGYDALAEYDLGLCPTNTTFNQPQAEAGTPNNWVGICNDASVGCTAYRDPKDPREINEISKTITTACESQCPLVKNDFGKPAELKLEGECSFGTNKGNTCVRDEDCPGGKCVNKCASTVCTAGDIGTPCQQDSDCGAGGACDATGISGCQSYYYLNSTVDSASCSSVVNEEDGCKLFNNTSGFNLSYSTEMSADGYSPMYSGYCQEGFPEDGYNPCNTNDDCDGDCIATGESGPPKECLAKTCDDHSLNSGIACEIDSECIPPGHCTNTPPTSGANCDSNSVVKVMPDRICDEWLSCKTALEVDDPSDMDQDGKTKEMACFELESCQELGEGGQCTGWVAKKQQEIMGNTSDYSIMDMQSLSGYVYAGFNLGHCSDNGETCNQDNAATKCGAGAECLLISGYFPFSAMDERGLGSMSTKDIVSFGDFESGKTYLICIGGDRKDLPCLIDDECPASICKNHDTDTGLDVSNKYDKRIIITEDDNNPKIDSNNILVFTPDSAKPDDYLTLGIGSNVLSDGGEYTLSFAGKLATPPETAGEDIVNIDFVQVGQCSGPTPKACLHSDDDYCGAGETCNGVWEQPIDAPAISTTMSKHILNPVTVIGSKNNTNTYIRFSVQAHNPLTLDNVSLKPVLAVGQAEEAEVFASTWDPAFSNVKTQTFGDPRENEILGKGENCDQGWCMGADPIVPGPHSCDCTGCNIGNGYRITGAPDCTSAYPDCAVASWCALSLGESSNPNPGPTTANTNKITVEMAAMVSDQVGICDVNTGGTGCDLWVDENGIASTDKFKVYVSPALDIAKFESLGEAAGNQIGYFDISPSGYSEIRYVMIIDHSSGSGAGNAGADIDSVTSLNIPYDLVSRSCRAYPQEDSLSCHYFNSNGMEYNGWQGYCIDHDPSNPSRCITWYPIDIISGESLAFGTMTPAGYSASERTPLYMCSEAQDVSPHPDWLGDTTSEPLWTVLENAPSNDPTTLYLPRMVCLAKTEKGENDQRACQVVAIVSDPKPQFYKSMAAFDQDPLLKDTAGNYVNQDWRLGRDPDLNGLGNDGTEQFQSDKMCDPNNGGAEDDCADDCWNIIGRPANGDTNDGIDNVFCDPTVTNGSWGSIPSGCDGSDKSHFPSYVDNNCTNENSCEWDIVKPSLDGLKEMWHKVALYHWSDGGSPENCSNDNGKAYYRQYKKGGGLSCALSLGQSTATDNYYVTVEMDDVIKVDATACAADLVEDYINCELFIDENENAEDEKYYVYVSKDNTTFTQIKNYLGGNYGIGDTVTGFDIPAAFVGMKYVKILDQSGANSGIPGGTEGVDIDSISAFNTTGADIYAKTVVDKNIFVQDMGVDEDAIIGESENCGGSETGDAGWVCAADHSTGGTGRCAMTPNSDPFDGFDNLCGTSGCLDFTVDDFSWGNRTPRPKECKYIVQVVEPNGNNKAFSSRVSPTGGYIFDAALHPEQYKYDTNCSPFGGTPVIADPTEIKYSYVNGDGDTIAKFIPLQFSGYSNPLFESGDSNLCKDIHAGYGFYSCGDLAGTEASQDYCNRPITLEWQGGESSAVEGVNRLKRIFAYPYKAWGWNENHHVYEEDLTIISGWVNDFDHVMSECSTTPRPDYPNDYCYILPKVFNIKIKDSEGYVYFPGGGNIAIKFNTSVDKDQLPLQYFEVDWDDGTLPQRALWGGAPKSDENYPHVITYTYTCIAGSGHDWKDDCKDNGYPLDPVRGCCAFKPSITAYDNWAFDIGSFYGKGTFKGQIIVTP